MTDTTKCPECGDNIPEDAPQGLCPKCLMGNVLNPTTPADGGSGAEPIASSLKEKVELSETDLFYEASGKYTLLGEYARGGMGRVLLVHDESLGRDVALKELLSGHGTDHDGTPIEA